MENIASSIQDIFMSVMEQRDLKAPAQLTDNMVLLESGLDSLGFAILITQLEDELGFDPFTLDDSAYYPITYGDLVKYYVKYSAQAS